MKKSIPITVAALAVATAAVAGCTPATPMPPTIVDSGPSPAAFSTLPSSPCAQPPGAPPCPGGAGVWRPTTAESAIFAAKRFGAERLDATAARAALESGRPFLVGLPDGGNEACHTLLLVPGDVQPWILNASSISSAGHTLDRTLLTYGCGAGMKIPTPRVSVPAPPLPLDEAAKTEAAAAGKPFIYATCAGATVTLPDGDIWFLNRAGGATVAGDALDRTYTEYGCTAPTTGGAR